MFDRQSPDLIFYTLSAGHVLKLLRIVLLQPAACSLQSAAFPRFCLCSSLKSSLPSSLARSGYPFWFPCCPPSMKILCSCRALMSLLIQDLLLVMHLTFLGDNTFLTEPGVVSYALQWLVSWDKHLKWTKTASQLHDFRPYRLQPARPRAKANST